MKVTFTKSKTDDEMIEISTTSQKGTTALWGVVHSDFLYKEGFYIFDAHGTCKAEITELPDNDGVSSDDYENQQSGDLSAKE